MSSIKGFVNFVLQNKYTVYVLVMFMISYLVNQLCVYCLISTNISMAQELEYGDRVCDVLEENVTALQDYLRDKGINQTASDYCDSNEQLCGDNVASNETWCYWRYMGTGTQYQLLAGPLYIVMNSITAIPMGMGSELSNINRKLILVICCFGWSLMTLLGGFATEYWHVCVCRMMLGVFSAGCVPFCASMIADYYVSNQRGAAMGFFNWGIFLGYSMSFVLIVAEKDLGWRAVYFIAGAPGLLVAAIVLFTVKEPKRATEGAVKALDQFASMTTKLKQAAKCFADPVLIMVCLGGAIRNGAGIVWAYNSVNFFDQYHPDVNVEVWLSWIPLVFGSIGSFGGGYISDKLTTTRGTPGRLLVLIGCLLLSAPFQVGLLYFSDPWCFISHMFGYVIGEMWIGVCIAVVLDIVPADLTTSAVAFYFFIIKIIGGNMPLFVTPITNALNLRAAMLICFPGFYVVAGLMFIVTYFMVKKRQSNMSEMEQMAEKGETKEGETKEDQKADGVSNDRMNDTEKYNPDLTTEKSTADLTTHF